MKYRNLKLSFTIDNMEFTVLSIGLEKMVTPIPRHVHSANSYELHYISYGYGTLIANDKEYAITPGTFYVTGPGVFHEQVSKPDDPMTEYGVYLQIVPISVKTACVKATDTSKADHRAAAQALKASSITATTSSKSAFDETDVVSKSNGLLQKFLTHAFWFGEADGALHDIMKRILSELELRPLGYENMLPALLQELILTIIRLYQNKELAEAPDGSEEQKITPNDMTYLMIEEAFLYNYRDLTLPKLASQVNLSVRQTQRLLQKHYNKNFAQKKTEARMSAACILLQDASKSIASISYELGYSSSEHFTSAFKQFYRVTPSVYRSNTAHKETTHKETTHKGTTRLEATHLETAT